MTKNQRVFLLEHGVDVITRHIVEGRDCVVIITLWNVAQFFRSILILSSFITE